MSDGGLCSLSRPLQPVVGAPTIRTYVLTITRTLPVPAAKSKAELNKQQAGMVEARRVELEEMMVGELEHRMGGMHGLVTKLREHPLGDALLRWDMRRKRIYLSSLMSLAR